MGRVCTPDEGIEDELDTHDAARRLLRHEEMCPRELFIRVKAVLRPFHAELLANSKHPEPKVPSEAASPCKS